MSMTFELSGNLDSTQHIQSGMVIHWTSSFKFHCFNKHHLCIQRRKLYINWTNIRCHFILYVQWEIIGKQYLCLQFWHKLFFLLSCQYKDCQTRFIQQAMFSSCSIYGVIFIDNEIIISPSHYWWMVIFLRSVQSVLSISVQYISYLISVHHSFLCTCKYSLLMMWFWKLCNFIENLENWFLCKLMHIAI